MNKQVTIIIKIDNKKVHNIKLTKHLFRKVGLVYNNKFEGFYSITKITNRIRKVVIGLLN